MARTPRLPRIERISGLTRLNRLGQKAERHKRAEPPELTLPDSMKERDDTEAWIAYVYRDDRLAARVRSLMERIPSGSIPELVVYDWLKAHNIKFEYQAELFGGRALAGGIIPDFLLLGSHQGKVIQVQGDYWHAGPSKAAEDLASKLRLIGSVWRGVRITSVTYVWERNLRDPRKREQSLNWALDGIEMPGG